MSNMATASKPNGLPDDDFDLSDMESTLDTSLLPPSQQPTQTQKQLAFDSIIQAQTQSVNLHLLNPETLQLDELKDQQFDINLQNANPDEIDLQFQADTTNKILQKQQHLQLFNKIQQDYEQQLLDKLNFLPTTMDWLKSNNPNKTILNKFDNLLKTTTSASTTETTTYRARKHSLTQFVRDSDNLQAKLHLRKEKRGINRKSKHNLPTPTTDTTKTPPTNKPNLTFLQMYQNSKTVTTDEEQDFDGQLQQLQKQQQHQLSFQTESQIPPRKVPRHTLSSQKSQNGDTKQQSDFKTLQDTSKAFIQNRSNTENKNKNNKSGKTKRKRKKHRKRTKYSSKDEFDNMDTTDSSQTSNEIISSDSDTIVQTKKQSHVQFQEEVEYIDLNGNFKSNSNNNSTKRPISPKKQQSPAKQSNSNPFNCPASPILPLPDASKFVTRTPKRGEDKDKENKQGDDKQDGNDNNNNNDNTNTQQNVQSASNLLGTHHDGQEGGSDDSDDENRKRKLENSKAFDTLIKQYNFDDEEEQQDDDIDKLDEATAKEKLKQQIAKFKVHKQQHKQFQQELKQQQQKQDQENEEYLQRLKIKYKSSKSKKRRHGKQFTNLTNLTDMDDTQADISIDIDDNSNENRNIQRVEQILQDMQDSQVSGFNMLGVAMANSLKVQTEMQQQQQQFNDNQNSYNSGDAEMKKQLARMDLEQRFKLTVKPFNGELKGTYGQKAFVSWFDDILDFVLLNNKIVGTNMEHLLVNKMAYEGLAGRALARYRSRTSRSSRFLKVQQFLSWMVQSYSVDEVIKDYHRNMYKIQIHNYSRYTNVTQEFREAYRKLQIVGYLVPDSISDKYKYNKLQLVNMFLARLDSDVFERVKLRCQMKDYKLTSLDSIDDIFKVFKKEDDDRKASLHNPYELPPNKPYGNRNIIGNKINLLKNQQRNGKNGKDFNKRNNRNNDYNNNYKYDRNDRSRSRGNNRYPNYNNNNNRGRNRSNDRFNNQRGRGRGRYRGRGNTRGRGRSFSPRRNFSNQQQRGRGRSRQSSYNRGRGYSNRSTYGRGRGSRGGSKFNSRSKAGIRQLKLDPASLNSTLDYYYFPKACHKCTMYGHTKQSCDQLDLFEQDLKQMLRQRVLDERNGNGRSFTNSSINNISSISHTTGSTPQQSFTTAHATTQPQPQSTSQAYPSTQTSQFTNGTSNTNSTPTIQIIRDTQQPSSMGSFSNSSLTRAALAGRHGGRQSS